MRRMLLRVPEFTSTWWQSSQLHKTWLSYEENAVESAWIQLNVVAVLSTA